MIEQITTLMGVVGAIAFVVSVITQVLKGVKPLDKLPTDILVFILSIVLTCSLLRICFICRTRYSVVLRCWRSDWRLYCSICSDVRLGEAI